MGGIKELCRISKYTAIRLWTVRLRQWCCLWIPPWFCQICFEVFDPDVSSLYNLSFLHLNNLLFTNYMSLFFFVASLTKGINIKTQNVSQSNLFKNIFNTIKLALSILVKYINGDQRCKHNNNELKFIIKKAPMNLLI